MKELTTNNVVAALNTSLASQYNSNSTMLQNFVKANQKNEDINIVCSKILVVDYVYSTNLRLYRKKCSVLDIANAIVSTTDFDKRVENGDASVVNNVLKKLNVNLFSFMSKYCFVHNHHVYGRDNFSVYDSAVKKLLPKYIKACSKPVSKLTGTGLKNLVDNKDYKTFNDIVGQLIAVAGININSPRKAFDRFIWNQRYREEKQR